MQFTTIASAALALATLASCTNTILFKNQDAFTKNIVFTSNADLNMADMPNLVIPGYESANQTFEQGWIGNFFSFNNGSEPVPGMLGEVNFNSWDDLLFFDVSSIVNDTDTAGVKMLYPLDADIEDSSTPTSGCNTLGLVKCLNQYNVWDDVATKATSSSNLVCLLGNPNTTEIADTTARARRSKSARRNVELYPRDYVLSRERPVEA